jgi:hypothetical protein
MNVTADIAAHMLNPCPLIMFRVSRKNIGEFLVRQGRHEAAAQSAFWMNQSSTCPNTAWSPSGEPGASVALLKP